MGYTVRNSRIIKGLECCKSMEPEKCKECPYNIYDNPKCMIVLMDLARDTIIADDVYIQQQEQELRQARWGTNYGK